MKERASITNAPKLIMKLKTEVKGLKAEVEALRAPGGQA